MIHKLMENVIGLIVAITGLLVATPSVIKAITAHQKERAAFAEKLGIPQQSMTKMLTIFTERLLSENEELKSRLTTLEQSKNERDQEIVLMKASQAETDKRMTGLIEANTKLVEANEKLVQENDQLRKENVQLKADNATIKADNTTIKAQLRKMIQELQKAQLPLPDGVEHEGNGEKESGGGA